MDDLADLLTRHRVVSLIGSPGVGKTRLALEALHLLRDDASCSYLGLDAVGGGVDLMTAAALVLGIHDPSETYADGVIADALGSTPRYLLLDGAEHRREEVITLVPRLVAATQTLRLVITSPRQLGIPGEIAWAVPPLACAPPDAALEELASADAVALFVARRRERAPGAAVDLRLVAELCRQLGGLPLAIELIAAWSGTLTIEQILRDRAVLLGQRQTLDAVLTASYELLAPAEQRLLATLSVFADDFTFEDAQAVACPGDAWFGTHLRALVDASWLSVHERGREWRFTIADTVRDFGRERLHASSTESAIRRRHAQHFAELARDSEEALAGPDSATWIARMRAADADLHEALQWSRDAETSSVSLSLAASLWRWWLVSGRVRTGRTWLAEMLETAQLCTDLLTGRALRAAAIMAAEDSDPAQAVQFGRQALRVLASVDDRSQLALAASVLGSALRHLGDHAEARRQYESALRWRIELGDNRGHAATLNDLALVALDTGRLDDARRLLDESLAIKRRLGEPHAVARGLCNLSEVLIRTTQLDAAEIAIAEANAIATSLGDRRLSGNLLCNRGDLAGRRGHWSVARQRYRAALRRYGDAGHPHDVVLALVGLGRALLSLGHVGEGMMQLHRAEVMAERTGSARPLAYARAALADATCSTTDPVTLGVTARQAEVLGHLAAGLSNKEIARILHLSVATVERHLATVYRNVGLHGRVAAARFATENGLLRSSG